MQPTWRTFVFAQRGATSWGFQWWRLCLYVPFWKYGGPFYTRFFYDHPDRYK